MNTPTELSAQPYSTDETPPRRLARPLLRRAAMERMKDALTLAGAAEMSDALLADVERNAAYLQRCANEAEAVLHGDLDAATRLWLLLRQPINPGPTIPSSILIHVAGDAWRGPLRAIDGDALLTLIAGVVRAANQPSESDAMLGALARLLQPLFHLDVAAASAEQARQGSHQALETFVTARWASQWRPVDPAVLRDPVVIDKMTLDPDRVPFKLASWRDQVLKPTIDPWDWGWPCMGGTRKAMSEIDRFGARYTIDSITNPEACAGGTVTIRGRNFGKTGRVSFARPNPKDPAFEFGAGDPGFLIGVTPKRWTDTEIDVVVPVWATAGDLHLDAFTRHEDHCTTIDVYRLGNSVLFRGGLASVYQVSLGGVEVDLTSTEPRNLTPNDAVALTWHSSGGPTTRIKIQLMDSDGATVLWEQSNLPGGFGGVVLSVPDPKEPRSATLVFTATSACGATGPLSIPVWISVAPHLNIEYVEVTQGVQRDLADVLAGRGLPTVAFKDTAVRVHLSCDRGGWFSDKLDKITGALLVGGFRLAPTNTRLLRDRGFVEIKVRSNPSLTNDTLNFTIPAALLTPGAHSLTVKVVCDDPSGRITLGQTVVWNWVENGPLRVRALYMKFFTGSYEFLLAYTRRALDFMPTPLTDIGIALPVWLNHDYDLTHKDGWHDLVDDLEDAWDDADEASGVRWLGVVPAEVESSIGGVSGTPSIAVLATERLPEVGAHELGHSVGLNHVNLPVDGPEGPYEPATDNGGFLRRPPFDVRPSTAVTLPAGDLMSYQQPVRAGISSWMRLFDEI